MPLGSTHRVVPDAEIDVLPPDSGPGTTFFRRHVEPAAINSDVTFAVEGYDAILARLRGALVEMTNKLMYHEWECHARAGMAATTARDIRLYSGDVAHWLTLALRMLDPSDNPSDRARAGGERRSPPDHRPPPGFYARNTR